MIRSFLFLFKLGLLVWLASFLVQYPGEAEFTWRDTTISTSMGIFLLLLVGVVALAVYVAGLWRAILSIPSDMRRAWDQYKQKRGLEALTQGFVAVAAGEADRAHLAAKRADKWLKQVPLKNLLSAQAAQLSGDQEAAAKYFKLLLEHDETSFLGVRGLLTQALGQKNYASALKLANRAYELMPDSAWVLRTKFELEARQGEWGAANETLEAARRKRGFNHDHYLRYRVALLLEQAKQAHRAMNADQAYELFKRAYQADHDFVPAAVSYADALYRAGKVFRAKRVIDRAWRQEAHPSLSHLVWRQFAADDDLGRLKRFEQLQKLNPTALETHLILGEAALAAKIYGLARGHVEAAIAKQPTARGYRLLAKLAASDNDNRPRDPLAVARMEREFNMRAMQAEPDPAWVCGECAAVSTEWQATCSHCGAFAELRWQQPAQFLAIAKQ